MNDNTLDIDTGSTVELRLLDHRGRPAIFRDWYKFDLTRGINKIPGTATFSLPYNPNIKWHQLCGLRAAIHITPHDKNLHFERIMEGYIVDVNREHTAERQDVQITVQDKTIDLEDCNPVTTLDGYNIPQEKLTPSSWSSGLSTRGETPTGEATTTSKFYETGFVLETIVKDLCKPFDIEVVSEYSDYSKIASFETNELDTVANHIKRLCQKKAAIPYTNQYGQLVLGTFQYSYTRPGPWNPSLHGTEADVNGGVALRTTGDPADKGITLYKDDILKLTQTANFEKRFSGYKTHLFQGDADNNGGKRWSNSGEFRWAEDRRMGRWRPMVIKPDMLQYESQGGLARWIMQTHRGASHTVTIELRHWYKVLPTQNGFGRLRAYHIGDRINLALPEWGISGAFIVAQHRYSLSGGSHRKLSLTLKPAQTYNPLPKDDYVLYPAVYDEVADAIQIENALQMEASASENQPYNDNRFGTGAALQGSENQWQPQRAR